MKISYNIKLTVFCLLLCQILFGCIPGSKIVVNSEKKNTTLNISTIAVLNNQLIINGVGLKGVSSLKLKNATTDQIFSIESTTNNKIVANAQAAIAIGLNQAFDLIINSAAGAATFPITFTLSDGSITAAKLSTMGASIGEVLKFNGTSWVPSPLPSGQLYMGSWNASINNPDVNAVSPQAGDYYIVTIAGTQNIGSGSTAYAVGDWIMYNGTTWDKIDNSTNVVGSFKGRRGAVVPTTGDYTWAQITKTGSKLEDILDIDITGRADQKVLKWDATSSKWVMGSDNSGGGAFSGSANKAVVSDGSGALTTSATTATEIGYVAGVTSAIQTQLNAKASSTLSSGYFLVGNGSNVATGVAMSGDATITNAGVISLKNTGTAGTYTSVTTDAQGRVTSGSSTAAVTSITATAPVAITASTTPVISMAAATTSVNGYLTATDWTTFNGKQAALSAGPTINGIDYPSSALETLVIPLAPVNLTDAVNKQYVDGLTGQWTTATSDIYRASGSVGIGTNSPGSTLDVKGILRLSGSTSGYVGFAPAAAAGATTYTLPITQGSAGQVLSTNGVATNPTLSWVSPATSAVSSVNTQTGAVVLTTSDIAEGTNLYSTNARTIASTLTSFATGANSSIAATDTVLGAFQKTQGQLNAKEPAITAGTRAEYLRGDKSLSTFATDVITSVLTGLSTTTNSAVTATDTVLIGMGKLQAQVSGNSTSLAGKADLSNVTQSITASAVVGLTTPLLGSAATNRDYVDGKIDQLDKGLVMISGTGVGSIASHMVKGIGQITVTNGSTDIVGIGTLFTNHGEIELVFSDGKTYYVDTVTDDTHATIETPWTGATSTINYYFYGSEASGDNSIAIGHGSTASGISSLALLGSKATGIFSIGIGGAIASGNGAVSIGNGNNSATGTNSAVLGGDASIASGFNSLAMGKGSYSAAMLQTTIGQYNQAKGSENATSWVATDPLFVIGNGSASNARSNALMLLKNGNMGLGTNSPSESIETTGNIKAVGFISTSDIRLKKNITKTQGLTKVLKLEGVEYDWKKTGEHDYGLIAQAVELIFPHAVVTDSQSGYKAIKYQNLISPVIEAIKDLYKMIVHTNDDVSSLKREIASVKEKNDQLTEENALMKKEFVEMKMRMDRLEKNSK
jgi:hypothetical protein